MSVEREGRGTPEEGSEFMKLYEELKEHHRVSMLINNGSDELARMSDAEQDKWYDNGLDVMVSISKVLARDAKEIKLKAQAAQMICDIHGDSDRQTCSLDYAINHAGTYEAVDLSVARDVLRSVA